MNSKLHGELRSLLGESAPALAEAAGGAEAFVASQAAMQATAASVAEFSHANHVQAMKLHDKAEDAHKAAAGSASSSQQKKIHTTASAYHGDMRRQHDRYADDMSDWGADR